MHDVQPIPATVTWAGDAIEIIDQTLLPGRLEVIRLTTTADVVDAIRRLAVRGAPAIGGCGALGMVVGLDEERPQSAGESRAALERLADRIGAARPTAVNLSWAVERVRDAAHGEPTPSAIRDRALVEAQRIVDEDREACRLIGEHGRAELGRTASAILTHCNAGRLATLGWGTALGVVYAKAAAGEPVRVFACEARPLLQGARLTAWELTQAGIDVTLITDSAAAPGCCIRGACMQRSSGPIGSPPTGTRRTRWAPSRSRSPRDMPAFRSTSRLPRRRSTPPRPRARGSRSRSGPATRCGPGRAVRPRRKALRPGTPPST